MRRQVAFPAGSLFATLMKPYRRSKIMSQPDFESIYGNFRGIPLKDVLPLLEVITSKEWEWYRNSDAKYITIGFDTRDGGWAWIKNRNGEYITLTEAMAQHTHKQTTFVCSKCATETTGVWEELPNVNGGRLYCSNCNTTLQFINNGMTQTP